eukprot:12928759-Prorocentrum_lima.AAC.1
MTPEEQAKRGVQKKTRHSRFGRAQSLCGSSDGTGAASWRKKVAWEKFVACHARQKVPAAACRCCLSRRGYVAVPGVAAQHRMARRGV